MRRRAALPFAITLLFLAGCGGYGDPPPGPPQDQTLIRHERAGQLAYSLEHPAEAVAQYQSALRQAEARDDLAAIGDLSFNLVVAELRANQPAAALITAQRARAELLRRGGTPFPALDLAEATALYRTGAKAQADALAAAIQDNAEQGTAFSASFLRGLIADDANNSDGLAAALGRLNAPGGQAQQADRAELAARVARRDGDMAQARSGALQAADLRRLSLDYRGMARALALAADAARLAGDRPAAADLFLRAGRSAAAQNDPDTAKPWLQQAIDLSQDSAVADAAQAALDSLAEP
jgi:hypothetical protein